MFELIFITSNSAKLSHAKHLCKNYAVKIAKQKNYGVGYYEPKIENRDELLKISIEDAIVRFRKTVPSSDNKFFFIEDTSVIVQALSKEKEVPGVNIKYWMQEMNFASIDNLLKANNNNRHVKVRSDLILVLNKDLQDKHNTKYKIFTSFIEGNFAEKNYIVKTQPLYPWLSGKTFNKWFIPLGCKKPISLLSIEEADKHDFRASAFNDMLEFLHKENIIKTNIEYAKQGKQSTIFEPTIFIICGPTCAGKTTLATFLQNKYNYYHIEASDFMYLSYYDRHGFDSSVPIGDFAAKALKDNPTIVADQIIQNISKLGNIPFLITGFRSPDEIAGFIKQYKGGRPIETVYIEADQTIRFKRNLLRARIDSQKDIQGFAKKDDQQSSMGLSLIKKHHDSDYFINNNTLDDLYIAFENKYKSQLYPFSNSKKFIPYYFKKNLQNAIILTLHKQVINECFTTTEISYLINNDNTDIESRKNKNNISRYFNQNFHPFFEISTNVSNKVCYKLSQTGHSYANWIINNMK